MYVQKVSIDEELIEIRFSHHSEERALERGVHLGQIEDLVVSNYNQLLDAKLGEEVKLICNKTGVVAPVSIDVKEVAGDWIVIVTIHTTWIYNKLKTKERV